MTHCMLSVWTLGLQLVMTLGDVVEILLEEVCHWQPERMQLFPALSFFSICNLRRDLSAFCSCPHARCLLPCPSLLPLYYASPSCHDVLPLPPAMMAGPTLLPWWQAPPSSHASGFISQNKLFHRLLLVMVFCHCNRKATNLKFLSLPQTVSVVEIGGEAGSQSELLRQSHLKWYQSRKLRTFLSVDSHMVTLQ